MLRNPGRSPGGLAASPSTIGGLCCRALTPAAQPLLPEGEPLLLDKSAISQFGLSGSAEARQTAMPTAGHACVFAFCLGISDIGSDRRS